MNGIMKQLSKSKAAKDLIEQLDKRLSKIKTTAYGGEPIEHSNEYSNAVASIKEITCLTSDGSTYQPFSIDFAHALVDDELACKREDD